MKAGKSEAPEGRARRRRLSGQAHHHRDRRAAARAAGPRARQEARSGPISRRWCPSACRSRCWSSARARSASSSPRSTARFGAEVTIVEVLPQILPVEDAEIAAFARKSFEKQGIKILTGAKVTKLDKKADSVTATIDDGKGGTQTLTVERVISAVGVVGNIENLGLEKARREDRPRRDRGRRAQPHQRARHLRDRRRRRPAAARAQGRARRRHLRRGDQGPQPASDGQAAHSRLHLLLAADRLGRPDRAGRQGEEARRARRAFSVRRQRQGDRARRGSGPGQGDLRQEDRRSCSARTWSARR